jgi:2-polyprenyl-3-methyl-5-hydroxy-6-metoxy-1,4-benzoquinol methylase
MRPDYHAVILDRVPAHARSALDVGCGTGALTGRLRGLVPDVVGIDRDQRCIASARAHPGADSIRYLAADFLTLRCPPESFDLITVVASLHHMDTAVALRRMRDLLRPGGVLGIIGLARGGSPIDVALTVTAAIGVRWHAHGTAGRPTVAVDEYAAPVCWPPSTSYRDIRRLARLLLPGARYRRHLYWRYSLVWTKPTASITP